MYLTVSEFRELVLDVARTRYPGEQGGVATQQLGEDMGAAAGSVRRWLRPNKDAERYPRTAAVPIGLLDLADHLGLDFDIVIHVRGK